MTTESNDTQTPVPGTPEYDQMMIDKKREAVADGGEVYPDAGQGEEGGESSQTPSAPEGVPAKFIRADGTVDVEALAKSYTELEKGGKQDPVEPKIEKPDANSEEDPANAAASDAGLNVDDLQQKVIANGKIDESDYEALEKAGVSRAMVDDYIALRQAQAERVKADTLEYIGGEQATNDLMTWAAQNLSADDIDAYNEMLAGPRWKVAVDTLKAQHAASKKTANEPTLTTPQGQGGSSADGYVTRDEQRADMADPLYHASGPKGDAFRAQVQRKTMNAAWRNS